MDWVLRCVMVVPVPVNGGCCKLRKMQLNSKEVRPSGSGGGRKPRTPKIWPDKIAGSVIPCLVFVVF